MVETALQYGAQGFYVLPLAPQTKRPSGKLIPNGVHGASADLCTIRRWWRALPDANIGIACGADSKIIVLDVDPRGGGLTALDELTRQQGPLPDTVTVRTGRGDGGRHLYFKHPGGRVRNRSIADAIDVKADGGYVVAPPSVHPGGGTYTGHVDRSRLANVPPWLLRLLCDEYEDSIPGGPIASVSLSQLPAPSFCDTKERLSLTEAIEATIPSGTGHRNSGIFEFARRLKAIPRYKDASADLLRPHVRAWHKRALPLIGTKSFDETWCDFAYAWARVRYPAGGQLLLEALRRAKTGPLPSAAERYDSDTLRLLVALCRQLQWSAGSSPFFLSCRSVAALFNLDRMTAYRRLRLLVDEGTLAVAQPGTKRRATRYLYLERGDPK